MAIPPPILYLYLLSIPQSIIIYPINTVKTRSLWRNLIFVSKMKSIEQIFIILLFYALGEVLSLLIAKFIPGSVLGMMLLFTALKAKIIQPERIDRASDFLTQNMGIFFVPAGVGLITQLDLLKEHWFAIVFSMILSTIIVLGVVAWTQQTLEKKAEQRHQKRTQL